MRIKYFDNIVNLISMMSEGDDDLESMYINLVETLNSFYSSFNRSNDVLTFFYTNELYGNKARRLFYEICQQDELETFTLLMGAYFKVISVEKIHNIIDGRDLVTTHERSKIVNYLKHAYSDEFPTNINCFKDIDVPKGSVVMPEMSE
ncbi:MAG: hypothetical protein HQL06_05795 [Nitrospirae bacterium]|nr:hypothetical protein [Nitrospirota bacterium]